MQPEKFEFGRSRGVVWVCDLVGSSRHLNSPDTVAALEEFLPRMHWIANVIVEAAGGKFIKWIGDGFLAWFETPLHRDLGKIAGAVFGAASDLTCIVNVTQLCVTTPKSFKVRHGITFEQDALTTTIRYPTGVDFLDLIGRAVVLAFRLSGVPADHPSLVTEKILVDAYKQLDNPHINFGKWKLSEEDLLKYFKGEKLGTSSLYVSKDKKPVVRSKKAFLKQTKALIAKVEDEPLPVTDRVAYAQRFVAAMHNGPQWCQAVITEHSRFVKEELLGALKTALPLLEQIPENPDPSGKE